jgi:hypothetical protein
VCYAYLLAGLFSEVCAKNGWPVALPTLATHLLHGPNAPLLLRRVISRRRHRCELSVITIIVSLLHQEWQLLQYLSPHTKFNLRGSLCKCVLTSGLIHKLRHEMYLSRHKSECVNSFETPFC